MTTRHWLLLAVLFLALLDLVVADDDGFMSNKIRFVTAITAILLTSTEMGEELLDKNRVGHRHRDRQRKFVNKMFNEYGPTYARRAYRMHPVSFWKLEKLLNPYTT